MLTPTAEVEVPTDPVRRLLAGQHLPMRNSPRVTAPFHQPAAQPRRQVWGHFTNRLRPGESGATGG